MAKRTLTSIIDQMSDQLCCAICLTTYIDPRIMKCGHTFCYNCILHTLLFSLPQHDEQEKLRILDEKRIKLECPLCKQETSMRNSRKVKQQISKLFTPIFEKRVNKITSNRTKLLLNKYFPVNYAIKQLIEENRETHQILKKLKSSNEDENHDHDHHYYDADHQKISRYIGDEDDYTYDYLNEEINSLQSSSSSFSDQEVDHFGDYKNYVIPNDSYYDYFPMTGQHSENYDGEYYYDEGYHRNNNIEEDQVNYEESNNEEELTINDYDVQERGISDSKSFECKLIWKGNKKILLLQMEHRNDNEDNNEDIANDDHPIYFDMNSHQLNCCDLHEQQLENYCVSCKKLICSDCYQLGPHYNHENHPINEIIFVYLKSHLIYMNDYLTTHLRGKLNRSCNDAKFYQLKRKTFSRLMNYWSPTQFFDFKFVSSHFHYSIAEEFNHQYPYHYFHKYLHESIHLRDVNLSWIEYRDNFCGMKRFQYNEKIFFVVSRENNWKLVDKQVLLRNCPHGFKWASTNEFLNIMDSCNESSLGPVYKDLGGWNGFVFNGSKRVMFCFSDSDDTKKYKHAGDFPANFLHSNFSSCIPFAGIVCIQKS